MTLKYTKIILILNWNLTTISLFETSSYLGIKQWGTLLLTYTSISHPAEIIEHLIRWTS